MYNNKALALPLYSVMTLSLHLHTFVDLEHVNVIPSRWKAWCQAIWVLKRH